MCKAIKIRGLSKKYGDLVAVNNFNLDVENGELFGLIGPDGAGKSTIYKILATLLQPNQGDVSILGLDLIKDYQQLRSTIGYMPERFSLYPDLTVKENLHFFASLFGINIQENFKLIEPVYAQLAQFPNRYAGKLSGGMKQKLALCCALIHKPKVLLLDEPTTGVDAVSRSEFWNTLSDLKQQGITIIVSTSYMDEASRCDRVGIMNHGNLLRCGAPDELCLEVSHGLYAARARDMYLLLTRLRELPAINDSYTFGDTIHFTVSEDFDALSASKLLAHKGIQDLEIFPITGNLEDLLISLIRNE